MNIWTVLKSFRKTNYLQFFSSLKDECIIEKDYLRAISVWNVFKINAMGDYHDLYLKTDVLLLPDVFEKFIDTGLQYYGSWIKLGCNA